MKLEIKTEFICKICGKSMSFKGIGCHFKSHNITIKEYYDKFLKNNKYDIIHINSSVFLFSFQVALISKLTKHKIMPYDEKTKKCKRSMKQ